MRTASMKVRPIIVNYSFIVTCPHHKTLPQNATWKLIIRSRMEKKNFFSINCKKTQVPGIHWSLIKISLIQGSSAEQRLFMLLPTLISTIVLTETFFDIRNLFKVKSSLAKINLNQLLALDKLWYFYNWYN